MPTIPDFPSSLARYGDLKVTPRYRTLKSIYANAQEQRIRVRLNPIYDFEIDYAPLLPPPLDDELIRFWHLVGGDARSFYFQDWTTPDRTGEMIGIGNGARTVFKLHEDRVESAVIYLDDVAQTQGATPQVTVDEATGLMTFSTAPTADAIVTADVVDAFFRVRFDGDELPLDRVRPMYWRMPIVMTQIGTLPADAE
jgi:hypothetical protein